MITNADTMMRIKIKANEYRDRTPFADLAVIYAGLAMGIDISPEDIKQISNQMIEDTRAQGGTP